MPVWLGPAPKPGLGRKLAALGLPGLEGAGLQHRVPTPEDTAGATALSVHRHDAEQRPPERGAICNPTTYENVSKQGFLRAKCWFGLTFQSVLRR